MLLFLYRYTQSAETFLLNRTRSQLEEEAAKLNVPTTENTSDYTLRKRLIIAYRNLFLDELYSDAL